MMSGRVALALACAALCSLVCVRASAVELYPDPSPRVVVVPHDPSPRVVVVPYQPPPTRVVLREPPPTRLVVRVRDDGSRAPIVRSDPRAPRLVIGGGIGPMFMISDPRHAVVPLGHLHVGLAVDGAEFGVRVGLAPYAATISEDEADEGPTTDVGLYTADATFTYRFLPEADVHPILGAGLGAVVAARDGADPAIGFGLSIRAGLELGVRLPDGELGVGLDAIGTQVLGAEQAFPWALGTSIAASAHLDYRF